MLPFETPTIFEQLPRFIFKMPRVVADQKAKFESDELFRRLSRETEVRYTGYRDRPLEERRIRFQNACREGHTEVVHIKSCFIMNGVCVRWRGWVDLDRLDGVGCLEYDEERGRIEDALLREQIERYNQRLRDFEEKHRAYRAQRERQTAAELEARKKQVHSISPERSASASN